MPAPLPASASGGNAREGFGTPVPADQATENVLPLQASVSRDPASVAAPRQSSARGPVRVSILMCTYNEEQTVMRAVGDVLTTKYPCEIELIVVDDGSTDASRRCSPSLTTAGSSCTAIAVTAARVRRCSQRLPLQRARISCRSTPTSSIRRRISPEWWPP